MRSCPVADRTAAADVGVLPVVRHEDPATLVGLVTASDLLDAQQRLPVEERRAERVLTLVERRTHPAAGAGSPARTP
jgi:hypothetical protein